MRYSWQKVSFLTQHGKEKLLQPLFSELMNCELVRATGFDTDKLGTFTRDIRRPGSQISAARLKARKAIELSHIPIGMGSEGAFGIDPVGGLMPWNTEVLVWIDSLNDSEIIGIAQGPGGGLQCKVENEEQLEQFAIAAGFPNHGLVLRPDSPDDRRIRKGLCDHASLYAAFRSAVYESIEGCAFVEVDLRAHMNPARQKMILRAAENLIAKLQSTCPMCEAPGFWKTDQIAGLPCALCRRPTRMPFAFVWACGSCRHTEKREDLNLKQADPARCDYCNP